MRKHAAVSQKIDFCIRSFYSYSVNQWQRILAILLVFEASYVELSNPRANCNVTLEKEEHSESVDHIFSIKYPPGYYGSFLSYILIIQVLYRMIHKDIY